MKDRILKSITAVAAVSFGISSCCVDAAGGDIYWPAIIVAMVSMMWIYLFTLANEKSA